MDFSKLANIQQSIAADVWPNGALLECHDCGYSERITSQQAGSYLRHGWPKHCGRTMSCDNAAAPPTEMKE